MTAFTMFLCGDVMTGRGIDQILPHPGDPTLRESYCKHAKDYWRLAEVQNGPIPAPVSYDYIWGEALLQLAERDPEVRIINLETSVTVCDSFWPKGINYRMNPANLPCLLAARIDCCCLANNHVLDFGPPGLSETLRGLRQAGIATAGAGENLSEAAAPAIIPGIGEGRVVVLGLGCGSSGIPGSWSAASSRSGVHLLPSLCGDMANQVIKACQQHKRPGDIVVASIHWGGNWGYEISEDEQSFAHRLIDSGAVDIVHGHSSHHPKAIEVYSGKLILYGCGDFINDYEGIGGHDQFRSDLAIMYLPTVDTGSGKLIDLTLLPFQIKNFRLQGPSADDRSWLQAKLDQEGGRFGTRVRTGAGTALAISWRQQHGNG